MLVVLQRVTHGQVTVDGNLIGRIGLGYVLLVGITHEDTPAEVAWLAKKVAELRIFHDADGKMNHSISEVGGEILCVSQFTLYGNTDRGRRPSFSQAARPEVAEPLFNLFVETLRTEYNLPVETGQFGAMMDVQIHNDGPVTLILEK